MFITTAINYLNSISHYINGNILKIISIQNVLKFNNNYFTKLLFFFVSFYTEKKSLLMENIFFI